MRQHSTTPVASGKDLIKLRFIKRRVHNPSGNTSCDEKDSALLIGLGTQSPTIMTASESMSNTVDSYTTKAKSQMHKMRM